LLIASAAVIVLLAIYFWFRESTPAAIWISNTEPTYLDEKNQRQKFPLLLDEDLDKEGTVDLTLVVPAYNEEQRLPKMLDETLPYLKARQQKDRGFRYEIIIIDDGSKDKTTQMALEFTKKESSENFRVLTLQKNRGKGGAVRRGALCSRGKLILMVDADGATQFSDLDELEKQLKPISKANGLGMALGSRSHLVAESVKTRSFLRTLLMHAFHFFVYICVRGGAIEDTQCGFKLFTRKSAKLLFPNQHIERWAFDVELIFLCLQYFKIPLVEVQVGWTEIEGSKLDPFSASIQMAKDLLRIRLNYMFGVWRVHDYFGKKNK